MKLKRFRFKKPDFKKPDFRKRDLLFIVISCSISAVAIIGILIPNGLTTGGITGCLDL